jgi:fatty-acyl-CoA synthase
MVRIYDDRGQLVSAGTTGRIFVGNDIQFEGYTGGGGKERIDGLMSVGDLGHFDASGRLFVEGREDDMIVSGGENVFPNEVEDLLSRHPDVADVAVVGVADDEFGQRLKAVVVKRPGAQLTATQVKDHVKENLARYKVPRDVVFVAELPRNATGKILRRQLR